MDHAYLESTVSNALTDALTSLSLVMAKSSSTSHPIIDPIDYVGRFLLHRSRPKSIPLNIQHAIDEENKVIAKYYVEYQKSHPQRPIQTNGLEEQMIETQLKETSNLSPEISEIKKESNQSESNDSQAQGPLEKNKQENDDANIIEKTGEITESTGGMEKSEINESKEEETIQNESNSKKFENIVEGKE
ncbi:hypothetical protein HMI54_015805 [Coelomomyces lativittatus]|nr:hypothetical protein HMI54_015805 [Coelomomyces lativittatus]KAJ1514842.1 hypothetical protein HMI55_004291 [Coelomomyces lativittatus]KAJ1515068.1 hypothetical protein HMI56_006698 [Coelomomyces lativittatus]